MTSNDSYLQVFKNEIYLEEIEDYESSKKYLRKKGFPPNKAIFYSSFISTFLSIGIGELVVKENVKSMKKNFYLSAKCRQKIIDLYESNPSEVSDSLVSILNYRQLMAAIISDHTQFIQEFAKQIGSREKIDKEHAHPFDYHVGYAVKWLVLGEDEKVPKHIEKLKQIGTGRKMNRYRIYADLIQALIDKNQENVQEGLERLLKSHKSDNLYIDTPEELFSIPVAAFAKMALMRGIQVEIDDPICPKEVLEKHEIEYPSIPELEI